MPPLALQIISFIQLAIQAAPLAVQVYADGKRLFERLFAAGLISAAQQDELMSWADAHMNAALGGEVPPALVVTPTEPA